MEHDEYKPCELCGNEQYDVMWINDIEPAGRTLYRICTKCKAKYEIMDDEPETGIIV